jgi:hypothetical protein
MDNPFFDHPILNSPYDYPERHWELDAQGQPTQQVISNRRRAQFITPIPKPKKRTASADQQQIVFDEGKGLSTQKQQYDITAIINRVRQEVDQWRNLPTPPQVTPETARLLQHWRHHKFNDIRPFFCQVEAVETVIWLTEVAPHFVAGKSILDHLDAANKDANGMGRQNDVGSRTRASRRVVSQFPARGWANSHCVSATTRRAHTDRFSLGTRRIKAAMAVDAQARRRFSRASGRSRRASLGRKERRPMPAA